LQVAEGALTQIQEIGHRLRDLSIQYNLDILTTEDKNIIESETKELLKEINHIIENTRFGELKVFEKDSYIIQTGPYSGDTYEIKLPDLSHLKEICINGQQDPPSADNNGRTGNVGDNNHGNVEDIGNNNDDVGGVGDDNNDNGIGGIGDNDDNDNGDVGGIYDGDDNGDVGGVDDDGNDNGGVGGIGDGNNNKDTSLNGYQKLYNQHDILIYDGFMRNREYHGYGKLYSKEGILLYDGFWNDDFYHQFGKLYNEQGQLMYEGDWENGKKQGFGKTFYTNGRIQYEGNWYNDVYHGWGKSFKENGQIEYEGEWVNGKPKTVLNTSMSSFSFLSIPNRVTLSVINDTNLSISNTVRRLGITNETDTHEANIQSGQNIELLSEDNSVFEEFNISDILKDNFIDDNILKPISGAVNHIGVMENTLSLRFESQIRNEELKENTLSNITDIDVAKELMNYIKNQMLLDTNIMLLHQNLSNQRQYILQLLS
jgi:flagellin-like hook-associated protein FlgL